MRLRALVRVVGLLQGSRAVEAPAAAAWGQLRTGRQQCTCSAQ